MITTGNQYLKAASFHTTIEARIRICHWVVRFPNPLRQLGNLTTHVPKPTILAKIWNCTRPNCIGIQIFGRSFSRTERKLTFPGGFHGLEVVGLKRLLTIRPDYMIWANSVVYRHQPQGCSHCVYSICKYNAGPKSVWKYTHLANNHHKPYTARISFSSKLVSIVFS